MTYRIRYSARAEADIEAAFLWIAVRTPRSAATWRKGLLEAIESLSEFPLREPLAPEGKALGQEIRQILFGKRKNRYRVLFAVEKKTVRILHIRHAARDWAV